MPIDQPPQLPGHQLILRSPENERTLDRTRRYIEWLREPIVRKGEINEAILAYEKEPIDPDEVARAPLFEFGKGFARQNAPEYREGEEPPVAPLSQEEMRLLLVRVLPTSMIPFALEHFRFDFEEGGPLDEGEPPPGPTVQLDPNDNKINITFHRQNFITDSVPHRLRESKNREDRIVANRVVGFIDPSKVTVLLGHIIGKMIEPPSDWDKTVGKKFKVTSQKHHKERWQEAQNNLSREEKDKARLEKQWEDFVGLAMIAPDLARHQYPEAYQHFLNETDRFTDVRNDSVLLQKLRSQTNAHGYLHLPDINLTCDVRTEDQKIKEKGISPQIALYERAIARLNASWFMRIIGRKIVYDPPVDARRAAFIAEDETEIKKILEDSPDEEMRDADFGEILAGPDSEKIKNKNKARRYLLAASQAGEFAEWRIYAWLYRFSDTFKNTKGANISETDYKDLQAIYTASEKVGRIGTSVLPYAKVDLRPNNYRGAEYHGRKMSFYVRKDRAEYIKEVEKKVRSKSVKAVLQASQKPFKQFTAAGGRNIKTDEVFSPTPEGTTFYNGNLEQYLGEGLAGELSGWLQQAGVNKISPDALAVATVWYDYYKSVDRNWNDIYLKGADEYTKNVILDYGEQLNRPPEDAAKNLLAEDPLEIAAAGNPEHIHEQMQRAEKVEESILDTLGIEASQESGTKQKSGMENETKDLLLTMLKRGITHTGLLMTLLRPEIYRLMNGNRLEIAQEVRYITQFLEDPARKKSIALLRKIKDYEQKLKPVYTASIEQAAMDLANPAVISRVVKSSISKEEAEVFEEAGLKFTESELKEIEQAGITETTDATDETGAAVPPPTLPVDTSLQDKKRSQILQRKIKESDETGRLSVVIRQMQTALNGEYGLEVYLAHAKTKANGKFSDGYRDWLNGAGRIFKLPSFASLNQHLESAVRIMDNPDIVRLGRQEKNAVLKSLNNALDYKDYILRPSRQKKKPSQPSQDESVALEESLTGT